MSNTDPQSGDGQPDGAAPDGAADGASGGGADGSRRVVIGALAAVAVLLVGLASAFFLLSPTDESDTQADADQEQSATDGQEGSDGEDGAESGSGDAGSEASPSAGEAELAGCGAVGFPIVTPDFTVEETYPGEPTQYCMSMEQGGVVVLEVRGQGGLDTTLELWELSGDGELIASEDDTIGSDPVIETRLAEGAYMVVVAAFEEGSDTGSYVLSGVIQ